MRADVPRPPRGVALAGLGLVVIGVVSYFVVVLHFAAWLPGVRNDALPNLALVAIGLLLSFVGVRRAAAPPVAGRRLAFGLAAINLLLAGAFVWMLYGMSALPAVAGPTLGAPAPDFALVDQTGRTLRLADFHGHPLLLVFYRGHW